MIRSGAKDDGQDVIIVCFGVFKSLDYKRSNAVCPAVSIGRSIPSLASVVSLGEEMALAKSSKTVRVSKDVDATSDCGINLAVPESLASDLSTKI